jgi:hypothetical protein
LSIGTHLQAGSRNVCNTGERAVAAAETAATAPQNNIKYGAVTESEGNAIFCIAGASLRRAALDVMLALATERLCPTLQRKDALVATEHVAHALVNHAAVGSGSLLEQAKKAHNCFPVLSRFAAEAAFFIAPPQ